MQRNLGLDIVRSIAIILVLIAHLAIFFNNHPVLYHLLFHTGLYGVELFFVLSGFLIGQIVFTKLLPRVSFKKVGNFYLRRLLRIAPLYYFILISFLIINKFILKSNLLHLFHFVFLQNFFEAEVNFFAVSWTLSIQFWFYLLIPILLMTLTYKKYSLKKLLIGLFIYIVTIIILRIIYIYLYNPSFDFGIRKNIFLRLDSLFIGVVFALLKIKYKSIYQILSNFYFFLLSIIGLAVFYGIYVYFMINHNINYFDQSIFYRWLSWPLLSSMLLFFTIYFENNQWINIFLKNKKNVSNFFTKLSLYSFSIFLIHYEIYNYFEINLKKLNPAASIVLSTAIIYILAFLLYNLIEKSILLKRNKVRIK